MRRKYHLNLKFLIISLIQGPNLEELIWLLLCPKNWGIWSYTTIVIKEIMPNFRMPWAMRTEIHWRLGLLLIMAGILTIIRELFISLEV